jgi:hypothetical protein
MNRSYSKIRHIQEANHRLEKRLVENVISETDTDSKVRFLKLDKKLKEKYYNDVCKSGKLVPKDSEVEEYQEVHNQIKSPILKID